MLLRLAYLGLTNTFALLRLLPTTNRNKDIEILVLRHQISVLQRQLGGTRVRFSPAETSWPAPHHPVHPSPGSAPREGEPELGVTAASTVWQILTDAGIDTHPERASSTWAPFLRSQADALLACDFFETTTLTGIRMYVPVVTEHAQRRIRIFAATPHRLTCTDAFCGKRTAPTSSC